MIEEQGVQFRQSTVARTFHFAAYRDLLLVTSVAALVPVFVQLPLPLLRLPLGLVLVLFAPGYVLQAVLFARPADLDPPARIGASVGLSVALLPLMAIVLDHLPWGITLGPIVGVLATWTVLMALIAAVRRAFIGVTVEAVAPRRLPAARRWRRRIAATVLGVAILGVFAGGLFVATRTQTEALTEFYVTGAQGMGEEYPRAAVAGAPMEVNLHIANNEGRAQRYRVEVRSAGQMIAAIPVVDVAADARAAQPLRYALPTPGNDQTVDILLFRADDQTAYRSLRLWVNVREPRP